MDVSDDDIETMLIDAQLHVTAAGIRAVLPSWYTEICEAHAAEVERLRTAGLFCTAAVVAAHYPLLDDGVICGAHEHDEPYPCYELRVRGVNFSQAR